MDQGNQVVILITPSPLPSYRPNLLFASGENHFVHVLSQLWTDTERQPLLVYLVLRFSYTIIAILASSYSNSVGKLPFFSPFVCVCVE